MAEVRKSPGLVAGDIHHGHLLVAGAVIGPAESESHILPFLLVGVGLTSVEAQDSGDSSRKRQNSSQNGND